MKVEEVEFNIDQILPQSNIRLAVRYFFEWIKWALTGFKYRPQEEIDSIYKDICSKCPFIDTYLYDSEGQPVESTCGICGCPVNKNKGRANKIAYASTKCPHKPPLWTTYKL